MKIRDLLQTNRTRIISYVLMVLIFIGILAFIRNDYFLYEQTIVKVTDVQETLVSETASSTGEQKFTQEITGEILNGGYKGEKAAYTNTRTYSGAFDMNLKTGDELFVTLDEDHNISSITGFKRDFYIGLIAGIFILSLIILGQGKGIRTLIILILNILIFCIIFVLRNKGFNILLLYIIASVIFIFATLFIISGKNRKTLCAVIASVLSVTVTMTIAFSVIRIYRQSIHLEFMPFVAKMSDCQYIFYAGILISCLGAIMEIAITVSSAVYKLANKNPDITITELRTSGANIAADMMGALINVLLFTFVAGTIPMVTLAIANDLSIRSALLYYANLEIIRSLVGAIGIVLTVPVALYTTIFIWKKGEHK